MSFYLESEEIVMFGRKKLIEENLKLKDKIEILESDIKYYKEKENAMLNGKYFPDVTCKGCKYLVEDSVGFCTHLYCTLNNKCKDRTISLID